MDKKDTKQVILFSALAIIKKDGVQNLSANRIIQVAGISKGGFFYHFKQMEELYLFMLDSVFKECEDQLDLYKSKSFKDFMKSATEFIMSTSDTAPEIMSAYLYFLSQINQKPEYRIKLKNLLDGVMSTFSKKIEVIFKKKLTKIQRDKLIRIIDMHFIGLNIHYLILKDRKRYLALSKVFSEMVENYFDGALS